jgi:hypothetical protein
MFDAGRGGDRGAHQVRGTAASRALGVALPPTLADALARQLMEPSGAGGSRHCPTPPRREPGYRAPGDGVARLGRHGGRDRVAGDGHVPRARCGRGRRAAHRRVVRLRLHGRQRQYAHRGTRLPRAGPTHRPRPVTIQEPQTPLGGCSGGGGGDGGGEREEGPGDRLVNARYIPTHLPSELSLSLRIFSCSRLEFRIDQYHCLSCMIDQSIGPHFAVSCVRLLPYRLLVDHGTLSPPSHPHSPTPIYLRYSQFLRSFVLKSKRMAVGPPAYYIWSHFNKLVVIDDSGLKSNTNSGLVGLRDLSLSLYVRRLDTLKQARKSLTCQAGSSSRPD